MTKDEFESRLATLEKEAQEGGLSNEDIIDTYDVRTELLEDE